MITLFTYIDSKFPEIIPHFLYHYIDCLEIKHYEIILHSEADDYNRSLCLGYMDEYDIKPKIVESYSSPQKKDALNP